MSRILIVEDEATVLMFVDSALQRAGYETLTAGTLQEARSTLCSGQTIDLVFTDIHLVDQPDGGILVGEMARKLHPGIPIIYATGRALSDSMQSQLIEPSAFLPKPYNDEKVVATVAKFLTMTSRRPS
jgi:DNA-binding NtrC family response regulator